MLYILAFIIILYTATHFLFKKNPTYLKVGKYVDIATIMVTTILIIAWDEVFRYGEAGSHSFLFIIYFLISLSVIIYLVTRLRAVEVKKAKAENVIKELKTEEKVLEDEINVLENVKNS